MNHFFKLVCKESVRAIVVPLVLFAGIAAVLAYSEPTSAPTGGTVYVPLNTSSSGQTKNGPLTVSGTLSGNPVVSGNYMSAPQYCIGGSCITSWPSGGGQWATSGSSIYNTNGGNVGIGTSGPGTKLDVQGGFIRVGRFYVGDTQYGTPVPGVGTDGTNVGVTTNGVFAVTNGGSFFQPVQASDYYIANIGKWASQLGGGIAMAE